MNKEELAVNISVDTGLQHVKVRKVINSMIKILSKHFKEPNSKLSLRGFGVFTSYKKENWKGRNPKTGEIIECKGYIKVKFSMHDSFLK